MLIPVAVVGQGPPGGGPSTPFNGGTITDPLVIEVDDDTEIPLQVHGLGGAESNIAMFWPDISGDPAVIVGPQGSVTIEPSDPAIVALDVTGKAQFISTDQESLEALEISGVVAINADSLNLAALNLYNNQGPLFIAQNNDAVVYTITYEGEHQIGPSADVVPVTIQPYFLGTSDSFQAKNAGGTVKTRIDADGALILDQALNITSTFSATAGGGVGFFGAAETSAPIVPLTDPTVQNVIDALVALGLVTQSD